MWASPLVISIGGVSVGCVAGGLNALDKAERFGRLAVNSASAPVSWSQTFFAPVARNRFFSSAVASELLIETASGPALAPPRLSAPFTLLPIFSSFHIA